MKFFVLFLPHLNLNLLLFVSPFLSRAFTLRHKRSQQQEQQAFVERSTAAVFCRVPARLRLSSCENLLFASLFLLQTLRSVARKLGGGRGLGPSRVVLGDVGGQASHPGVDALDRFGHGAPGRREGLRGQALEVAASYRAVWPLMGV